MSGVEGLEDSSSEGWGYDYAVIVQNDAVKRCKLITVLIIWAQLSGQVRFGSWETILDFIQEVHHARVTGCGRTNVIP